MQKHRALAILCNPILPPSALLIPAPEPSTYPRLHPNQKPRPKGRGKGFANISPLWFESVIHQILLRLPSSITGFIPIISCLYESSEETGF